MTLHSHRYFTNGCYRCDLSRDEAVTALADAIRDAWNTPPWSCNLDVGQQAVLARIAAHVAIVGQEPTPSKGNDDEQ